MPFKETCPVEERIAMFRDYDTGAFSIRELAGRHNVSRETFYVWQRRRESGDPLWFEELSRAPSSRPHRTSVENADAVIAARRRFPHFGPKKIKAWLADKQPQIDWPAASTIGDILKQAGLVATRRSRRPAVAQGEIVHPARAPNEEWAIDFKGWFRTIDGTRCDPLTVTDAASRYLLQVRVVDQTYGDVRCALERLFDEVGLPDAMRSDNGTPFGSIGAGGLSALSVWLLKLGIEPRYIPPSSPQHNGRHERMHRTLKAETTRPAAATAAEQQARFDRFRQHYNEDRPHEALEQTPPARHWQPSARRYPAKIPDPWYDADHEVRRVRSQGDIKWRGEHVFIGEALSGELVGLLDQGNGRTLVRFCGRDLGTIDDTFRLLRFAPPRARLRSAAEPERGTDKE
jgi:transposase InsO family protein/transposase-like protein